MQRGIYSSGAQGVVDAHWFYYDSQWSAMALRKRVRISKKLAAVGKEYPTKSSVRQLADDILTPINTKQLLPESATTLADFIETYYFPMTEKELRPSTWMNYKKSIYEPHLKSRLTKPAIKLRDFRTVHGQRLLRTIPDVGHTTLLHIKNFLSGVFRFARREGILDSANPMTDVTVPGRPVKFKGAAYSLDTVARMIEDIEDYSQKFAPSKFYGGNSGRGRAPSYR